MTDPATAPEAKPARRLPWSIVGAVAVVGIAIVVAVSMRTESEPKSRRRASRHMKAASEPASAATEETEPESLPEHCQGELTPRTFGTLQTTPLPTPQWAIYELSFTGTGCERDVAIELLCDVSKPTGYDPPAVVRGKARAKLIADASGVVGLRIPRVELKASGGSGTGSDTAGGTGIGALYSFKLAWQGDKVSGFANESELRGYDVVPAGRPECKAGTGPIKH